MELTLYQTLDDRDNADYVEEWGPFIGKKSTWLGDGYYFWDASIKLGHWWGEVAWANNYMICEAIATMDATCWDLHGDGMHRIEFADICEQLIEANLSTRNELLVPDVIEYVKQKGFFEYTSIRALGVNSIRDRFANKDYVFRVPFKKNQAQFLDVIPPVQICLLMKNALNLRDYRIVFPEHYTDVYV